MFNSNARTVCEVCGGTRPGHKAKAAPAPSRACTSCGGAHDATVCPFTSGDDKLIEMGGSKSGDSKAAPVARASASGDSKDSKSGAGSGGAGSSGGKNERIPPALDRLITLSYVIPSESVASAAAAKVASGPQPVLVFSGDDNNKDSKQKASDDKSADAKSADTKPPAVAAASGDAKAPAKPLKPESVLLLPACTDHNVVAGDNQNNQHLTQVLDGITNEWRTVRWDRVRVGHLVRVSAKERCPADVVIVRTASANNDGYAQAPCFDGDQKLRYRRAAPGISKELFRFIGVGGGAVQRSAIELEVHNNSLKQLQERIRLRVSAPVKRLWKFYGQSLKPAAATGSAAAVVPAAGAAVAASPAAAVAPPAGTSSGGSGGDEKLDIDTFFPRNGLLLLADWMIGVVVYTGYDTKYSVIGGFAGAQKREAKRLEKIEKEKAKAQAKQEERKAKARKELPSREVAIAQFSEQTGGLKWADKFTDVPDDGNCLLTAFWLGLTTLIRYYPSKRRSEGEEKSLGADSNVFRAQLFAKLKSDKRIARSSAFRHSLCFALHSPLTLCSGLV